MRATIAALMARSKREIPHYYLTDDRRPRPGAWPGCTSATAAAGVRASAARRPAAQGGGAGRTRSARSSTASGSTAASTAATGVHLGVADLAARRRTRRAGHPRRRRPSAVDELMAAVSDLVTRTRAGRLRSAETRRRDHHGVQPRRPGRRVDPRRDLPAPGRPRRIRTRRRPAVGGRRHDRHSAGRDREPRRRPPGHRRATGARYPHHSSPNCSRNRRSYENHRRRRACFTERCMKSPPTPT